MSGLGAQATHGRAAARQQMSAAVRAALRFDVMVTSYSPLEALARDSIEDDVGEVTKTLAKDPPPPRYSGFRL